MLALVIAIALIAVATALIATAARQNKEAQVARASQSSTNFGKIEKALLAYAIEDNGDSPTLARFPCAADPTITGANFGTEGDREGGDDDATSCEDTGQHNRGIVPFKTLGLSENDVRDAYGNFITYVVSTDTSLCNADTGNVMTGTVTDAEDNETYLYALISHGANGLGAYGGTNDNVATQKTANGISARETQNCPNDTGACTVASGDNQTVRSGPTDTESGSATYFDDRVFFPTTSADSYTANCEVLFKDDNTPTGAIAGGFDIPNQRNYQVSADNNQTDTPQFDDLDVDGDGIEESRVLRVYDIGSSQANGERLCSITEQTFPLFGHTIRAYSEAYFAQDTGGTLGNGLVLGWLGARDTSGIATEVLTTSCGGRDEFNGWGQEDASNTFNTAWERFGVEIDTRNHRPGSPVAGDIIDPDNNHFAIVLGSIDHYGSIAETAGENPEDNSPVCLPDTGVPSLQSLVLDDANGDGTAPADRSPAFNKEITGGVGGANTDDQACYFDQDEVNWLEDGDPFANSGLSGVNSRFHQFRFELHGESSNGCGANQFRYDAWVWRYSDDTCVDGDCDNLTEDYTGEEPHISQCVDYSSLAHVVRFAITSGVPQTNEGAITLKRTGLNFTRIDGASKSDAAATFVGTTITELGIRNGLFSGTVDTTDGLDDGEMDQSWVIAEQVDNTPNEVRVFADRGIFDLNGADGIAVDGVGFDANHIDNIRPNDATYDPLDDFLSISEREKLTFEWDSKVTQVTINLRDFGDDENASFTSDNEQERVRIRAYDTTLDPSDQLVADEVYQACRDTNGDGTGITNGDGVISTSFSAPVDKIEIIPEPIRDSGQAEYLESWSMIVVSAVKGCGAEETCGFAATDAVDANQNQTENRCAELTFPQPTTTGLTAGTEVNPTAVLAAIGRTDNTNDSNYDRAWIDLSESGTTTDLGVDIYTASGQIGINDTATEVNAGFGISSGSGTGAGLLDTLNPPTGASDESDRESMFFRFDQRWERIVVGLSRFGRIGGAGTANERARIRAYADGELVGTVTVQPETVGASCDFTNSNNSRFDATIVAPGGTPIDTIEVTAMANSTGGQSSFYVRGLQPCPSVGLCAIDYGGDDDAILGNPDNDAGDLFCESTFNL